MSRSTLAAGLRYLRNKLAAQQHSDDSDEQLLHAFTSRRDETAFAILMRRHGPMVMHVCLRVLGHEQDAEDAFQATFLVLARHAASLRNKASLAGFLHGIAYRTAMKAKQSAARRRKHEGSLRALTQPRSPSLGTQPRSPSLGALTQPRSPSLGALTQPRSPADPVDELSWREAKMLLDEEITRLPEKYRSVFILCCLENVSHAEAARRLRLKEGTLSSRLTTARKLLSQRLRRRGVELTAVLVASMLATQAAPALSPLLISTTIKVVLATMAGEGIAGVVSAEIAALASSAAPTLVLSKAKMALGVMLAACALAGAGVWACRMPGPPQTAQQPTAMHQSSALSKPQRDKDVVVMVKGRVLLPDGKPAANAAIIRRQIKQALTGFEDSVLTMTGADGRFQVEHRDATILIASAPGFAPDWSERDFKGGDLTLRLSERATVRGQLISLEGKPIAGARVKVLGVNVPIHGNLNAVKDAFRLNPEWADAAMPKALSNPVPGSAAEAKTDADGRFELEGFGKNRVLLLQIEGDGIASDKLNIILVEDFDPKSVSPQPRVRSYSMAPRYHPTVYGPRFTHAVRPCQVVTGVVTDDVTGKPIPGVKVVGTAGSIRIFDYSAWKDAVEAVTDRDGRYCLHGLAKVTQRYLHIQAGAAPYLDRLIDVADAPGVAPRNLDIKLHKAVVIEGRLIDKATGKGVRGEVLFLLLECDEVRHFLANNPVYSHEQSVRPSGMNAQSDAEGRFKLHVPPVPLVILARASDAAAHYTPLRVAEVDRKYLLKPPKEEIAPQMMPKRNAKEEFFNTHGLIWPLRWMNGYALVHPKKMEETIKVFISFDPGRTIRGKIIGPDGQPLAGVEAAGIHAVNERAPTTFRTDAFTVYALDPSRPRTVYFRHVAKNLVGTIMLRGDETEAPVVKMQPGASVVGRVLDAVGKPLAGMDVSIQFTEAAPDELIRQRLLGDMHTTTDANGRFRLEGMFPGLEFEVFVGHPGHRSMAITYEAVTLKAGEVCDLGERREQKER
jgi:RNA polymerase sigma factor (sigma-70 family)